MIVQAMYYPTLLFNSLLPNLIKLRFETGKTHPILKQDMVFILDASKIEQRLQAEPAARLAAWHLR